MASSSSLGHGEVQAVRDLAAAREKITDQIGRAVIGHKPVIDQLLTAILGSGHCLLVGVPGLAKTLLVSSLSRVLSLTYHRLEITPNLTPDDITGAETLHDGSEVGRRRAVFLPGRLFANVVLADEINRTPPGARAILIEAMRDGHVTSGGQTYRLPEPFFVAATVNPVQQEGTYPLPQSQLDRFMFSIRIDYPSRAEEVQIMKATTGAPKPELTPVLDGKQIARFQEVVRQVVAGGHVFAYAADLVRATRPHEPHVPKFVPDLVAWGAGPRASQCLILGAKARAVLHGRVHATTEDVKAVALPVLRHRVTTTFHADASGITPDAIIEQLLEVVPTPVENGKPRKG